MVPTWPTLLLRDARDILSEFDAAALRCIGDAIEVEIEQFAEPYAFPTDRNHWIWTRVEPSWVGSDFDRSSSSIRETFGDLNIFLAFHNQATFGYELRAPFNTEEWHLLAIIAIWKLIDAYDAQWPHREDLTSDTHRIREIDRMTVSAGLAMEAQAACATALQFKERARHIAELNKFRDQLAQWERQQRASDAGIKKSELLDGLRDQAVELANKGKYLSFKHASDWIVLKYADGKIVPKSTIRSWLKLKGWKKYKR